MTNKKSSFKLINMNALNKLFKEIRYIIREKEIDSTKALCEIDELIRLFEVQLK